MALPVVNAIWIGRAMGPMHAACLRSFVVTGHRVVLHAYGKVDDAPAGVERADANRLLSESNIIRHRKTGSFSLASNLMRYEILRLGLGLYVDCDVFCHRPMEDADYIFGRESNKTINNAVLKVPMDHKLLDALREITKPGWIPPWARWKRRAVYKALRAIGRPVAISAMPWGATGPRALTWYARQCGIDHLALPYDAFYPVSHQRLDMLFDPELTIEDVTTRRTHYVHLYHHTATSTGRMDWPSSSPLGRLIAGT